MSEIIAQSPVDVTVRALFEHWMSDEGKTPKAVERHGDGYKLMQAQICWTAWQAANDTTAPVIAAARCIRHWHDREPDGMVVSAEHVRKLWDALHTLEAPN